MAIRVVFKLALLILTLAVGVDASPAMVEEAWSLNRTLEFNESEKRLKERNGETEEDRSERSFARAVTLFSVQPRTAGNIEEAYELLDAIVTSGAKRDIIAWSIYYLGRIDQIHRAEPQPTAALTHYGELIDRYPEHIAAQLGFIKSAIIRLYADPKEEPPAETVAALENEAEFLSIPFAKHQFHAVMADGYLFFDLSRERALEHLLAARALGSFEIIDLGGDHLRIANIAYELGKRDIALSHYLRFLEMRPKSDATYKIRERIGELEVE